MQRKSQRDHAGWLVRWLSLGFLWLLAACGAVSAPLSAQEKSPPRADDGKTGKAQLEQDYETLPLVLLPGQFSEEARSNRYKLGHWAVANLQIGRAHV